MQSSIFGSNKIQNTTNQSWQDSFNTTLTNTYTFDSSGSAFDAGSPSLALNYATGGSQANGASAGGGLPATVQSYLPYLAVGALLYFGMKFWK